MIYFVAGEASGDLHGSNLIKEIKKINNTIELRGVGGDLMQNEGMHLIQHYKKRAFMGITDVLLNLKTIKKCLKEVKKDIKKNNPKLIVLIDNPGFNMIIAKYVFKLGIPVHYYIAPKVWAWNTKRVVKIKKYVNQLYCILPFEIDFFPKHGVNAIYVGNPVKDALETKNEAIIAIKQSKPLIALLPGSRPNEINKLLPTMLALAKENKQWDFCLAEAPNFNFNYQKIPINVKANTNTYGILKQADLAIVASGTATLETALLNTPQIVVYKVSALTYFLGKQFIKVKYISLVNLILNKLVVKELIQNQFNKNKLKTEIQALLLPINKIQMEKDYAELHAKLGNKSASKTVANHILKNY